MTPPQSAARGPRGRAWPAGIAGDLAIVAAAFAVGTAAAELLGAANLGTALSFGQLSFAAALLYVLLRR